MGVTCTLHRVSDATLQRLMEGPETVAAFLNPEDESAPRIVHVRQKGLLGILLRILRVEVTEVAAPPAGHEEPIAAPNNEDVLEPLTPEVIKERFDPARMTRLDVYPKPIWMRPAIGDDPPLEWLLGYYRDLRAFVAGAAAAGDAVIVRVS